MKQYFKEWMFVVAILMTALAIVLGFSYRHKS